MSSRYLRVQARYRGRLGAEVRIFVAVDHLRRAGMLTAEEVAEYLDADDWFREHLPNPPFYYDGNSVGAVTWFKTPVSAEMSTRVLRLRAILDAHGVRNDAVGSDDPGEILYEDEFQVGVVPQARQDPTPMPEGLMLGPTSPGPKRQFEEPLPSPGAT